MRSGAKTTCLFGAVALTYLLVHPPAPAQNINITKDRIQFSDGTQQSTAATTTSARTVTVNPTIGNATTSGQTLRDAIAAIAGASADFPYHVILEPGTFDLGATTLNLPEFVNLRGAGMSATVIRGNPVSAATDPVLRTNGNGVISDLTVRHKGGAGINGRTVIAGGASMRFQNVKFEVSGSFNSGATLIALATTGGCKTIAIDCVAEVVTSSSVLLTVGVFVSGSLSTFTADGLTISVLPSVLPGNSIGLWCSNSDDVEVANANIFAAAGTGHFAVLAGDTSLLVLRNSVIETTPGGFAMHGNTGAPTTPVRVLGSQVIGSRAGDDVIYRNCVDGNFSAIP